MREAALTRLIHGISRELLRAAFCDYFGVRDEHADILVLLYDRPGEPIPVKELARLLNSHRPPTRGAIHERVRFIREILEPESLDSGGFLDDRGYYLTELGVAECVKALKVMAEVLTQCGPASMINGELVEGIRAKAQIASRSAA